MKVLGSAVLAFEAIVVLLAIPAATFTNSADGRVALAGGLVLAALLLVAIGTLRRPWGVAFGWVLQVLVVASGLVVPAMFIAGGIFALLWFFAVRLGRQVDEARQRPEPPG
jgi:hypothetical protein